MPAIAATSTAPGAGAAAIACLDLMVGLGVRIENIFAVDSRGVIREGRGDKLDESKQRYCQRTEARTLADVVKGRVEPGRLKGKIALVGTTAPGLLDLRSTPVDSVFPGVEIHANLIAGMMQVIVGGLALAAAHALATHAWQARLDALLANPWLLFIPLGLLLIGAGLLLVRRSSSYVGPLGTVLFIVPKTLTGVAVLAAGAAILAGWAWMTYDPRAFSSFIRLLPDEDMNLLANWWSAAIALLR